MAKKQDMFSVSCSLLLIMTVALLAPSAGLATLPIPDNEQDTVVLSLASYSHVGKRSADDPSRISLGFIPSGVRPERIAMHEEVLLPRSLHLRATAVSNIAIRAPPHPGNLLSIA